jgi:arylsulfatase A-like enzyme
MAMIGLTACGQSEEPLYSQRPPNILLIMADDLGYGDLGSYGQVHVQTPHLDLLAEEGIRFTNFYAGSTVCAPSRSVLITGQHTGHTHVRGNRGFWPMGQEPLPPETVTIADVMKEAGYRTGLIGKWGLGGPDSTGTPNRQGFDHFFGYLCQTHAHNYYPEFLFRNEGRVEVEGNVLPEPKRPDGAGRAIEKVQYSHDLLVEESLSFIKENRNQPFFLYLALTIPHANNEAGFQGMEVPDYGPYEEKPWPIPQKGMAAMVTRMDNDIGRIVQLLRELGLEEDTVILFTSDNGTHNEGGYNPNRFDSNGPLRGRKRDLYDGGIRVPLIVRWPGRIPASRVTDHICYLGDIMATTAGIAGIAPPPETDSLSLLPLLLGRPEEQKDHPFLYWEFYERGTAQAVRWGRWKAVRSPMFGDDMELYDLRTDIGEQNDAAAQHPEVVQQISSMMEQAHVPSPLWKTP